MYHFKTILTIKLTKIQHICIILYIHKQINWYHEKIMYFILSAVMDEYHVRLYGKRLIAKASGY